MKEFENRILSPGNWAFEEVDLDKQFKNHGLNPATLIERITEKREGLIESPELDGFAIGVVPGKEKEYLVAHGKAVGVQGQKIEDSYHNPDLGFKGCHYNDKLTRDDEIALTCRISNENSGRL